MWIYIRKQWTIMYNHLKSCQHIYFLEVVIYACSQCCDVIYNTRHVIAIFIDMIACPQVFSPCTNVGKMWNTHKLLKQLSIWFSNM